LEKDFNRDKFRKTIEDVRRKSRAGSDDFRRNLRDQNRPEPKSYNRPGPKAYERKPSGHCYYDPDRENFTEEFHERKVDYKKDVHTKREDC